MLPLPPFSYEAPDRIEQAIDLLAEPGSKLLAGGTDLLPSMKHRLFQPSTLVSLRKLIDLQGIRVEGRGISIGASTTLLQLRSDPWIQTHAPALVAAASTVATRTIQAMATLGGNLALDTRCTYYNQPEGWRRSIGGCLKCEGSVCHVARTGDGCYAVHSADTVPVLMLMGAEVEIQGPTGVRRLELSDLYDGEDGRRWLRLELGEIITRIHLPSPATNIVHHKVRLRAAIDYGALLVAVQPRGQGARAVISALGPAPIQVEVDHADDLVEAAFRAARPLNTHVVETGWRKHMVRVAVRRALEEAQT
jgi:4-hydroxybenzoyl-CoA reductase subunit beta